MIIHLIVGPFSTLHTLPLGMSCLLVTLTVLIASISLGICGVKPGQIVAADVANLIVSFIFILLSLAAFVWQFAWHRLEDNFDTLPWLPTSGPKTGLPCPFTGKQPSRRCPSCGALVHTTAFHEQDKLTTFYVGESVLGWDKANFGGNLISDPVLGRELLDEALDWRGNYYLGCTGSGCVGCTTWQRSFRMLPRWALCLACIACVGSLVPWAFRRSLATVSHGGRVQAIAETYGVFFSLTAVFTQLHAIACAVVFMTTYAPVLRFPRPVTVASTGPARRAIEFMAGQAVPNAASWTPPADKGSPWSDLRDRVAALPATLHRQLVQLQAKATYPGPSSRI